MPARWPAFKRRSGDYVLSISTAADWPPHPLAEYPVPKVQAGAALKDYFGWSKGNWGIAKFLPQCVEAEIPAWLREACITLKSLCDPPPAPPAGADEEDLSVDPLS
jgi:putative ATP-dependent endonuclease of OLD family